MVVLFMVTNNDSTVQTELVFAKKDYLIPRDHKSRFFVDFMEESMDKLGITDVENETGRTPYSKRSMLKLIVYAKTKHVSSSEEIEDLAKYHDVYKFVCDYITPDARTIRRYKHEFKSLYNELLKMTLKKAEMEDLTSFEHVAIDGTIKKAYNNIHNNITEKETDLLLRYYNGENIDEQELEKLHKSVKKFMTNKKLDDNQRIIVLERIKEEFKKTEQEKIPLNDIEARKMKGKRGNFKVAFNVQSAVDAETNLICAITVSQNPSDHYELPKIADKAINNIGKLPKYISADTIYLNNVSTSYCVEKGVDGLIPNRKQAKEETGRLNEKPYHKDHFEYDRVKDAFKCPEKQFLYFYGEYSKDKTGENNPDKIVRLYSNYHACKNCKSKNKCLSPKQTHRTITENGNELVRAMYLKMEEDDYREEYGKRSCVERPFGPLKIQYDMENEVMIGIKDTESFLTLDAVAYNINRLYNILNENNKIYKTIEENINNPSYNIQTKLNLMDV